MTVRIEDEAALVALAASQQGMVSRPQLLAAGFDGRTISRRVAAGWLTRVFHGVYRVGPFAGPWGAEMAALLACGPRAALARGSSLHAWELRDRGGQVEVVVPGGGSTAGLRAYRARVPEGDVVVRHGMRVTTPARTIMDLASATPRRELERLIEEAQLRGLLSSGELLATAERSRGRPGIRRLRSILLSAEEPALTRSEAERRLLELVRAAGLPRPTTNVRVAGYEVDFLWPQQRFVVEVDGYAFHGSRAAFERDRTRDAALLAAGYRVLRITWRQLTTEPERVIATLASSLRT